ncbi:MAG: hypothetical protein MCS20_01755 [Candidatus Phytoplasma mali]|nr:hypothetical protein [Candidatus Phytoplasma mali]
MYICVEYGRDSTHADCQRCALIISTRVYIYIYIYIYIFDLNEVTSNQFKPSRN